MSECIETTVVNDNAIAYLKGKAITQLPEDLYIPPQALEVLLDTFEGPLDLLLYLIRKQNIDILNIPIALITKQYMEYIELMQEIHFELAAEYLVMAAMLAEIKSRMLLPRQSNEEEDEQDPRAELLRKLQEYEQIKHASEEINEMPRQYRDNFVTMTKLPELTENKVYPDVSFSELMGAFKDVLTRMDNHAHHQIQREALSIRERMISVLDKVKSTRFCQFSQLFNPKEGRMGVVVTFIAILELSKQSMISIVQTKPYSAIHVKAIDE